MCRIISLNWNWNLKVQTFSTSCVTNFNVTLCLLPSWIFLLLLCRLLSSTMSVICHALCWSLLAIAVVFSSELSIFCPVTSPMNETVFITDAANQSTIVLTRTQCTMEWRILDRHSTQWISMEWLGPSAPWSACYLPFSTQWRTRNVVTSTTTQHRWTAVSSPMSHHHTASTSQGTLLLIR